MAASRPVGRPTKYTQEIADRICAELAEGKSLRSVCSADDIPSAVTVFSWFRIYPEFLKQYTRAKEESADAMADEVLHISNTPVMGETRTIKSDGSVEVKQDEMLGHRRLQIETRKWLMAKMKPKRYGDKLDMTTNGKDLPTPILGGMTKSVSTDNSDKEAS